MKTVGVISFQGDFERHLRRTAELGVTGVPVRDADGVAAVDALIIPGGESTTIGMLLDRFGMLELIRERVGAGFPVLGTCAGAILLADEILGSEQPRIGGLHVSLERNAYGRQIESFEARLELTDSSWAPWKDGDILGVFIRAPVITRVDGDVRTILEFEGKPVMIRQGSILAATFHPELTADTRVHDYFFREIVGIPEAG